MNGYLVMYHSDGDECHADLVDKPTYDNICNAVNNGDDEKAMNALCTGNTIQNYMLQTMCIDKWPFNDVNILGTVCIWMF